MDAIVQKRRLGGPGTLGVSVLLVSPTLFAFLASFALAHGTGFSTSGLWFVYGASMYLGAAGVLIAAILALVKMMRHEISPVVVACIGVLAACGVVLLWWAGHIYRNPWAPIR